MKTLLRIGISDVILSMVIVATVLLCLLPVGRALTILPMLLAVYLIPYIVYYKSDYYTAIGGVSLSVSYVMMAVFFILNLWQSTIALGSVQSPMLLYDAYSFHRLAHDLAYDTLSVHSPIVPYMGYSVFLSCWISLGIEDIAFPIMINIFMLLVAMLLVGHCVVLVVGRTSYTTRMAGYAMMLMAMIPGVMANATVLSKEPFVVVSMLMCINALYAIKQRHKVGIYILMYIVGLLLLSMSRPTYIYVLLLFMAIAWLHGMKRSDIVPMCMVLGMMLVALYIGVQNSWWGNGDYIAGYIVSGAHESFSYGDSQTPLHKLLGDYDSYTLIGKLLILPITTAVQFMIPFPFESVSDVLGIPISTSYHRMSWMWYMAAIPMLLFYLLHWWRRDCDVKLSLMALVSGMAYCVPALITGGVVSRYAFCFTPLLTIMGAYVLVQVRSYNRRQRRIAYVFVMSYTILLSVALLVGANPSIIL